MSDTYAKTMFTVRLIPNRDGAQVRLLRGHTMGGDNEFEGELLQKMGLDFRDGDEVVVEAKIVSRLKTERVKVGK